MYSVDTSSLIHAWYETYPIARFPTLWANLEQLIIVGSLRACEMVRGELEERSDALREWLDEQDGFFVPLDARRQHIAREILAEFPRLPGKSGEGGGDAFVIALARSVPNCTVVSQERKKAGKVKIPDVCERYHVPCVDVLGLLTLEKWTF